MTRPDSSEAPRDPAGAGSTGHGRGPADAGLLSTAGLLLGPLLAASAWLAMTVGEAALSGAGRATAAVAVWMAVWWLTQAVPLAVTALLPVVLFPLLGIRGVADAAAPYASSLIFLFMGGFIIGLAMQRWGLHRRFALHVLRLAGSGARALVAAMMLVSAGLSMWISNTATVVMMLPIAVSVLQALADQDNDAPALKALAPALLLGVAYAASIGGIGTLIGTPPNLVLANFMQQRYDITLDMLGWLAIGLPVVAVMLPLTWLYLTRIAYRLGDLRLHGAGRMFAARARALGPMSRGERAVLVVFTGTALAWLTRPLLAELPGLGGLNDASIALAGALLLFVTPVDLRGRRFVMDWETASKLPWEVLILFGGGLSLAAAISHHQVDAWLALPVQMLAGAPLLLVLLAIALLVIFLTEVTSNTAVTTALLPVMAASAMALDVAPAPLLLVTAVSASCAFMLPVATPPNAVVYASGQVSVAQMARAGLALNLVGAVVIALLAWALADQLVP